MSLTLTDNTLESFMKKLLQTLLIILPACATNMALAAPSINDMQGCQAVIQFVDNKLDVAPASYPADDVKAIRLGLKQYDDYIKKEIVTPGLLKFNAGDANKANAMQEQVDTYKQSVVGAMNSRYQENRLYSDFAVSINNCAKQAVPSGQALENLKTALNTIIKLAQSH